ncbi:MAG: MATE family efflux transporter [Deltaproteobacteria bacterium]|nr:MATE family efflux transporter [Deltaproteobacteria bacterium]
MAYQGLLASLLVSLVFTLVFWLIAPWIFRVLMHASDEVTQEGLPYLQVVLLSTPVVFLSITATQIFQSLGDTAKPMWLMIVALVITAFVDYALMLGRLGFPSIGVRGAGAAIIASRGVFCAAAIWILFSKRFDSFIVRSHGTPWMDWPLFRRVTAIGLPTAFEGVLFPVVYMLLTRYTTAHGTAEVAALRVGHTLEGLTFSVRSGWASRCVRWWGKTWAPATSSGRRAPRGSGSR